MVKSCAVYGCTNRFSKESSVSFHQFPLQNNDLCKKWIIAMKRDKFVPTKTSYICSSHFLPDDYATAQISYRPKLKSNAVPSIFSFPERLLPKKSKRKQPLKRKADTAITFEEKSSKTARIVRCKRNVKVAAQTLSSSVADAIQYLMIAGHPGFEDANGTIMFIRMVGRLFDFLNTRSPFGKGYKKTLLPP